MLEEYIQANYYARFDTCSYHCFREIHLNARHDVNVDRWMDGQMDGRTDGQTDGNSNSYVAPCYKQVSKKMFQDFIR